MLLTGKKEGRILGSTSIEGETLVQEVKDYNEIIMYNLAGPVVYLC